MSSVWPKSQNSRFFILFDVSRLGPPPTNLPHNDPALCSKSLSTKLRRESVLGWGEGSRTLGGRLPDCYAEPGPLQLLFKPTYRRIAGAAAALGKQQPRPPCSRNTEKDAQQTLQAERIRRRVKEGQASIFIYVYIYIYMPVFVS